MPVRSAAGVRCTRWSELERAEISAIVSKMGSYGCYRDLDARHGARGLISRGVFYNIGQR